MLNASVNIFGVLADGYTQYPDNYSQEIYTKFCELAKGVSQIVIHRDGDLMYYGYVRRMDDAQQCIGFCIILNGVMFSSPCDLLPVFESTVETLTVEGTIISFNEKGQIVPRIRSFVSMQQEVKRVENMILGRIGELSGNVAMLPPVDYSKPPTKCIRFEAEDSREEIADAAWRYAYTVITAKGGDSQSLNGYRNVVKRLSSEKWKVTQELAALKEKHGELKREKTQLRNVVILIILVAGCVVVLLAKVGALEQTEGLLRSEEERGSMLENKIGELKLRLAEQEKQVETLKYWNDRFIGEIAQKDTLIAELKDSLDIIKNQRVVYPLNASALLEEKCPSPIWNVKLILFSYSRRALYFSYCGNCESDVQLKVVVRSLDGSKISEEDVLFNVHEGNNSGSVEDVALPKGADDVNIFQLWYKGEKLGECKS